MRISGCSSFQKWHTNKFVSQPQHKPNIITSQNNEISPNFLAWKIGGNVHFRQSFGFPQNFRTRKSGEISLFCAMQSFILRRSSILPINGLNDYCRLYKVFYVFIVESLRSNSATNSMNRMGGVWNILQKEDRRKWKWLIEI